MNQTSHQGRKRRYGAAAAMVALLVGVAACGSDDKAASTTAAPTTVAGGGTTVAGGDPTAAGIEHAKAELAKFSAAPPAPQVGAAVKGDVSKLKGKEVWFLPIAYQFVPYFAVVEKGLQDAFGHLGMTVKTCDAASDPTKASSCINDAVSNKAVAIITDAVTHEFAPNAFDAALAANVAVVYLDGGYPSDSGDTAPWPKNVAYASFDGAKATALVADWMIVDSNGTATVLTIRISDTDWTKTTMSDGAMKEFAQYCPKCKVVMVDSNSAQTADRPSLVASSLAANPDTNYMLPNYDSTVEPSGAFEGAQNAGFVDKLKVGTTTGQLSGLQRVKDENFLYVNAGANNYQEAWAGADQAIRLLLGEAPIVDPVIQLRVFTKDNLANLELTQDAYLVGSFFGDSGFTDAYLKAWGVS